MGVQTQHFQFLYVSQKNASPSPIKCFNLLQSEVNVLYYENMELYVLKVK